MKTHHFEQLLTSLTGIQDRTQRFSSVIRSIPGAPWRVSISICWKSTGICSMLIRIRQIFIGIGLMLIGIRQILISIRQILVRICLMLAGIGQILIRIDQNPINLKQMLIIILQVSGKTCRKGADFHYKLTTINLNL